MIVETKKYKSRDILSTIVEGHEHEVLKSSGMSVVPSREIKYAKGEYVYKEDEYSNDLYLILSGCVKVAKSSGKGTEVVKSIIGVGSIFGEKTVAEEKERKEYAQVITEDTVIAVFALEDVLSVANLDNAFNIKLLTILGKKVESLERRLESIISKDSRTRIVDFLKEMAEENGKKIGFEIMIKNNFTHKDIASLTGTSRQTVTTTLNSLKEQNVINFDRRRILIRDMDLLV